MIEPELVGVLREETGDPHPDGYALVSGARLLRPAVLQPSVHRGREYGDVAERRDVVSDASGSGRADILALQVVSSGSQSRVEMAGEIDSYSAPHLRRCLRQLTEAGDQRIILDFRGIEFIDSAGLGVLIGAVKSLDQRRGELVVTSPRPQAAKLFEMTGLNTIVTVEKEA